MWNLYVRLEPTMESTPARPLLQIGEIARITGFSTKTLRYYEEVGLVKPTTRTEGGYRLYGESELAQLEFIKRAKLIGLTLTEIKELLDLAADNDRGKALSRLEELLEVRMVEIERQILELSEFRDVFRGYILSEGG